MATSKQEWFNRAADFIVDNLEDFYRQLYVGHYDTIKWQGKSLAIESCPSCGHHGSCKANETAVHCFSCKWSGTHINALITHYKSERKKSYRDAIDAIAEFIGEPFPAETPEEIEANRKHQIQQDILRRAADFYHTQLLLRKEEYDYKGTKVTPLNYLLNARKRNIDTIEDFKIGFSANWLELRNILFDGGFKEEEIDEAKIRIPDGLIIYFYYHHKTREIIRYNTKNPFRTKAYNGEEIQGYSYGPRVLLYPPRFSFKEPMILVEGENDLMSVYEAGYHNVACLGGRPSEESLSVLENCENIIYTAFDHDDAGDSYLELVNRLFPEKVIRKIHFPEEFGDIDEFFVESAPGEFNINEMMTNAEEIKTTEFKVKRVNNNIWTIGNRTKRLEFTINKRTDSRILMGQINLFDGLGTLIDREDDKSLASCKMNKRPMNFLLADHIKAYFDEDLELRSFDELASLYWNSTHQAHIIKLLAQHIYNNFEAREDMINRLREILSDLPNSYDIVDAVLKEMNDIQNREMPVTSEIRKMQISQFFSIRNNDAYFYFTNTKNDVDARRRLPFFLRNDKSLIRLDLIRRRDSQCLLLIDNKYELPMEIPTAPLDSRFCSLSQFWVDKYLDNQIDSELLAPRQIVQNLENFIKRFYYHNDESVYKILAMWAYGTYFYDMFKVFPYLYINGEKGAGKSALGKTLEMIAFNARMLVQTSEASLFRAAGFEGGTMILDEQETLTSRKRGAESSFGPIIKGGYTKGQNVARYDLDKKNLEYLDPYCPKAIINILGLDDIIGDRCIEVKSYRVKINKDLRIEDANRFQDEHIDEYREISSKCCLSALEYFQALNSMYDQCLFVTKNARLSQILNPILAIAKLVDIKERAAKKQAFPDLNDDQIIGEYETSFNHFYNLYIINSKNEIEDSTPEGIIKTLIPNIARELHQQSKGMSITDQKYINMQGRKYNEPIKYNIDEGWFRLNVLHFKVFLEEHLPGETMTSRNIIRTLKTCFDIKGKDAERRDTKIENEALSKEFGGNTSAKVYYYKFYFRDFGFADYLDACKDPVAEKPIEMIKAQLF